MSDQFKLEERNMQAPTAVIGLSGRFGAQGAQEFRDYCSALGDQGYLHAIVDLADVTFMASIGAGTLMIMTQVLLRNGGSMQIINLSESVARVVNLLNLDRFLEIRPGEQEALDWLAAKQS